jgi:gluconolactonase
LLKLTFEGKSQIIATECRGEPFLFPNDLCFGPDEALYLTDSGVLFEDWAPGGRLREDYLDAPTDGRLFRIDIKTGQVTKLDSGIRFTNGIAFGPDQHLYINETVTGMVYRYEWRGGSIVGQREDFGNVIDPEAPKGYKGPDGMAFGQDGKLYVTVFGQGDVTVLGRDGRVVERIRTAGRMPTNVAFGARGGRKIYVTEDELGQVEMFNVDTEGLPLYG